MRTIYCEADDLGGYSTGWLQLLQTWTVPSGPSVVVTASQTQVRAFEVINVSATVDGVAFRGTLSGGGRSCHVTGTYGQDSAAGAFTCEGGAITRFSISRNGEPDATVEERLPPVRRR